MEKWLKKHWGWVAAGVGAVLLFHPQSPAHHTKIAHAAKGNQDDDPDGSAGAPSGVDGTMG